MFKGKASLAFSTVLLATSTFSNLASANLMIGSSNLDGTPLEVDNCEWRVDEPTGRPFIVGCMEDSGWVQYFPGHDQPRPALNYTYSWNPEFTLSNLSNPQMPSVTEETEDGNIWHFAVRTDDLSDDAHHYIDPDVAIGYIYSVDSGVTIDSVILPFIGDNHFTINVWDEVTEAFTGEYEAVSQMPFSFIDLGLDDVFKFQVVGIETDEELDPTDSTAFITGLVFGHTDGVDEFNVTQAPIIQTIGESNAASEVPVPATLALFGLGLVIMARRRKAA
jgi:uncharacterized protein (TIGR03382 family)